MKTALNGFSNYIIYLELLNTSHKREVKATKQLLHLFFLLLCYWICTFIGVTQVLHVCTMGCSVPELLHIELHYVLISSIYKPSKIGLWRNSDSGNYGLLEKTQQNWAFFSSHVQIWMQWIEYKSLATSFLCLTCNLPYTFARKFCCSVLIQ